MKIGDRVVAVQEYQSSTRVKGQVGKIIAINTHDGCLVEFVNNVGGHNGNNNGEGIVGRSGHCWYMPTKFLRSSDVKYTNRNVVQI